MNHTTVPTQPTTTRRRRALVPSLLTAALVAGGLSLLPAAAPAQAAPNCVEDPAACIDPEPDPSASPPPAGSVEIYDRRADGTALSLRARITTGTRSFALQRRSGSSTTWSTIRTGSSTGTAFTYSTTNSGLARDSLYTYRVVNTNSYGSSVSPSRGAYTRNGRQIDVRRVQVRIQTADVSDAGTDGDVAASASGPYSHLAAERTWLDHSVDDFERASVRNYDLLLDRVGELGDLTALTVENSDDDDWCVSGVSLIIDGRYAFRKSYGNSTCRWLGSDSPATRLVIPHSELRASSDWQAFRWVAPYRLEVLSDGRVKATVTYTKAELEQRIEGTVGHALHGNPGYWGHISGPAVEARRLASRVLGVDLDLAADIFGPDPGVDVDFELHASAAVTSSGTATVDVALRNLVVDADYDLWAEIVSLNLVELVEDEIEDRVAAAVPDFAEHEEFDHVDSATAAVTSTGDLVFTFVIQP